MFAASLVVCAIWISNPNTDCKIIKDVWGPYRTLKNCEIRTNQMQKDLLTGEGLKNTMIMLKFPDAIVYGQVCDTTDDQPV